MVIKRWLILVLQWLAGWLQRAAIFFSHRAEKLAAPPAEIPPPTPESPRDNPARRTTGRPPVHWLEHVRSAGPPADWLARVAKAAPELLQQVDTNPELSDLRGRARRASLVFPTASPRIRPVDKPANRAQGRNKGPDRPAENAGPNPVEEPARSVAGPGEATLTTARDGPDFSPDNRFSRQRAASPTHFEPPDAGKPLTAETEDSQAMPYATGNSLDPAGSASGNFANITPQTIPQMAGVDGSWPENSASGNHLQNETGRPPDRPEYPAGPVRVTPAEGDKSYPFPPPAGLDAKQTRPVAWQPETDTFNRGANLWPDLPGREPPANPGQFQATPATSDFWPELLPDLDLPPAANSPNSREEQRRRRIDAEQRGENRRGTSRIFN